MPSCSTPTPVESKLADELGALLLERADDLVAQALDVVSVHQLNPLLGADLHRAVAAGEEDRLQPRVGAELE